MAIGGNSAELKVNLVFDNSKAAAALQTSLSGLTRQTQNFNKNPIISKNFTQPLGKITGSANEFTKSLEASNARVLAFGASAGAIFAVQKAMSELVKATISVEQALTDINVLLNVSDKQFKKFSDGLFDVAKRTGTAFGQVAESANEFARQGLSVEDTLKRTNAALALSKLGMMDSVNATESLTAALNTFKGEVTDAEVVVNKLAQVDAKFAVSSKDLAEAIKRTGASAQSASVSFEELLAAVTVTQERTARGGAVIGNAFKTIFTRIQRPEVLAQLGQIGIQTKNTSGEILPAIQILKQYGAVYDSLTPALRSNTSQLIAGGRQINILKSLLPELASGTGKFDSALRIANETTTEATDRLKVLTGTTQGTLNAVKANLTKTAAEIGSLSIKPAIDNILNGLDTITDLVGPSNFFGLGETIGKGVYEGIGKVLSGPGIILLATVLAKLGGNLLSFVRTSGAQFLGLNKQAEEQARTQTIIGNILMQRPEVMQKILSGQLSQNDAARVFSNELRIAEVHYAKLNELASSLAAKQRLFSGPSKGRGKGKAEGLIPNFVPNFATDDVEAERQAATQGGYRAGQIRRMNVPGMGGVTYNGKETVKEFPGMQQPAIMPPALSQAGKDYRGKFKDTIGFDPYNSARGFVPNFNIGGISEDDILNSGDDELINAYNSNLKGKGGKRQARSNTLKNPNLKSNLQKILGSGAPSARRAADATTAKYRKEAIQGGEIDIAGRIGLLSMFGQDAPTETTQTSLGKLAAFSEVIDAARATDSTGRNADILSAAKVTFKNVQVRSLEKAGSDLGQDKNEVYEKFRKSLNENMIPVLARVGADSITPILGNQAPKIDQIQKNIKTSSHSILPPGSEGDIFEQIIKLSTKSPKAFISSLGDDFRAPFDFEEKGDAGHEFRKQFFNKKGFKMKALKKADAKRTGDDKSVRSLIKKSYNQAILAEKSHERTLMRQFKLPYAGSRVTVKDEETGEKAGPYTNTKRKNAAGLIPNFSLKGISNAIQREDRSGVRRDKVRVGYDRRLAASGGIGVYNTDEGSLGNAINMHMSAGRNKSQIQRQGKADGHVPNFATRLGKELRKKGIEVSRGEMQPGILESAGLTSAGKGGGFSQGFAGGGAAPAMKEIAETTKKASASLKQNSDSVEKGTERRERGLGSLAGMILVGGQLSSFGDSLAESKSGLVSFAGELLSVGGSVAMFLPTFETAFEALGVKGGTLGEQLKFLGAQAMLAAANLRNMSLSNMIGGKGGVGSIGKNFTQGRGLSTTNYRGKSAFGRKMAGIGGGLRGVAGVELVVRRIKKKTKAAFANPLGVLAAAAGAYAIYWTKQKQKAEEDAFEKIQKAADQTKKQFSELSSALGQASATSSAYRQALLAGDKEEQKRLKTKLVRDLGGGGLDQFFKSSGKKITLKSGKQFSSEKDVTDALLDPTMGSAEVEELMAATQRVSSAYGKLKQSSEATALVFAHFNKNQRWWKTSAALTPEHMKQAASAIESLVVNSNMSSKDLKILGSGFSRLQNKIKGFGDYISEGDAMELNKEFKSLINQIPMEEGARKQLIERIDHMGDVAGLNEEGLAELYSEITSQLIPRIKTQAATTKNVNSANKNLSQTAVDAAKQVRDRVRTLVEGFDVTSRTLATSNKILLMMKEFEHQREKIITDANNNIFKALTTDFAQLTKANATRSEESSRKAEIDQKKLDQGKVEDQMERLKTLISSPEIDKNTVLKGLTTGNQNRVLDLQTNLEKMIIGGSTGRELAAEIGNMIGTPGARANPQGPLTTQEKTIEALKGLQQQFKLSEEAYENQLKVLRVSIKQEEQLNKIKASTALIELKEQQKLKFGSGIFETPDASARKLNLARQDVVAGRRLGDRDRETRGLIEQAKFFQGFQFAGKADGTGGINPAAKFTNQIAKRFQENAIAEMEKMTGRKATEAEKEGAFEIARKKALAITKDDKEVRLDLITAQDRQTAATNENTKMMNILSESMQAEALKRFTRDNIGQLKKDIIEAEKKDLAAGGTVNVDRVRADYERRKRETLMPVGTSLPPQPSTLPPPPPPPPPGVSTTTTTTTTTSGPRGGQGQPGVSGSKGKPSFMSRLGSFIPFEAFKATPEEAKREKGITEEAIRAQREVVQGDRQKGTKGTRGRIDEAVKKNFGKEAILAAVDFNKRMEKMLKDLRDKQSPANVALRDGRTIDHKERHEAFLGMWKNVFGAIHHKLEPTQSQPTRAGLLTRQVPGHERHKFEEDKRQDEMRLARLAAQEQQENLLKRANLSNAFTQAFGGGFDPSKEGMTQAEVEATSIPIKKSDEISKLIEKSRGMAQASIDMGENQIKTEIRRIEVLGLISQLEKEDSESQKKKLKTQIERKFADESFVQSSFKASEASRRHGGNLITNTELIAAAQEKLNNSYHDGSETIGALSDALGTRFQHNMATARKQASDSLLGVVDDFKSGTKEAFGQAIKGTKTLREAFGDLFDRLADRMLDDALDAGVDALFGAIGSGARALAGTPQTAARGGRIRGYNAGGFVDQGSGVRDDVPAMMQGGEYVIRKSSVDKYGRGLFESLNSGGMVGYARGDRVMKNRARPEFVYNDPKSPTSGSWQGGAGLSSFAMMESGSPMIAFQKEREKIFEKYIKDRAAYDEMVAKAKMDFRTAQRKRFQGAMTTLAIQAATAGLTYAAAPGADAGSGVTGGGSIETTTDSSGWQQAGDYKAGPIEGMGGSYRTRPTDPISGLPRYAQGGVVKGFAQGGRNRDNIPAMLMGGEYVMNKQSVDKYGVGLFNGLNNGTARGFAEGGPVGASTGGGAPSIANNNFEININITGDGETETTDASSEGDTTREQEERNEKLGMAVQEAVQLELIDQQRPGGLLYREDRL